MTALELLAQLGVDVDALKAGWAKWQAAHPGLAAPLGEMEQAIAAQLTITNLTGLLGRGARELADFAATTAGPIDPGTDPSLGG